MDQILTPLILPMHLSAADPDWNSATWLIGLAIAAAAAGGVGLKLRDLASA